MEKHTLKEQRQQIRKWYLMNQVPVPEYLKEENHVCDPEGTKLDLEGCPACQALQKKMLKSAYSGK